MDYLQAILDSLYEDLKEHLDGKANVHRQRFTINAAEKTSKRTPQVFVSFDEMTRNDPESTLREQAWIASFLVHSIETLQGEDQMGIFADIHEAVMRDPSRNSKAQSTVMNSAVRDPLTENEERVITEIVFAVSFQAPRGSFKLR